MVVSSAANVCDGLRGNPKSEEKAHSLMAMSKQASGVRFFISKLTLLALVALGFLLLVDSFCFITDSRSSCIIAHLLQEEGLVGQLGLVSSNETGKLSGSIGSLDGVTFVEEFSLGTDTSLSHKLKSGSSLVRVCDTFRITLDRS